MTKRRVLIQPLPTMDLNNNINNVNINYISIIMKELDADLCGSDVWRGCLARGCFWSNRIFPGSETNFSELISSRRVPCFMWWESVFWVWKKALETELFKGEMSTVERRDLNGDDIHKFLYQNSIVTIDDAMIDVEKRLTEIAEIKSERLLEAEKEFLLRFRPEHGVHPFTMVFVLGFIVSTICGIYYDYYLLVIFLGFVVYGSLKDYY